jgi:hypothetical protein
MLSPIHSLQVNKELKIWGADVIKKCLPSITEQEGLLQLLEKYTLQRMAKCAPLFRFLLQLFEQHEFVEEVGDLLRMWSAMRLS